jgi:hypothetical protein
VGLRGAFNTSRRRFVRTATAVGSPRPPSARSALPAWKRLADWPRRGVRRLVEGIHLALPPARCPWANAENATNWSNRGSAPAAFLILVKSWVSYLVSEHALVV